VNCITNAFISSVRAFIAFGLPMASSDSVVCIQGSVIIYAFGIVLQKTELLTAFLLSSGHQRLFTQV